MKLPRDVSGLDVVKALCRDCGYRVVHQEGSHIILETEQPTHHRLSVPGHKPIRVGTLNSIVRAVARHKGVERSQILQMF